MTFRLYEGQRWALGLLYVREHMNKQRNRTLEFHHPRPGAVVFLYDSASHIPSQLNQWTIPNALRGCYEL